MQVFDATVTIDARERSLIQTFHEQGASGQIVRSLPLGDVQCTYADGTGWLLERKTALDFAASIRDCLLYTSPSPRDATLSRMPSSA